MSPLERERWPSDFHCWPRVSCGWPPTRLRERWSQPCTTCCARTRDPSGWSSSAVTRPRKRRSGTRGERCERTKGRATERLPRAQSPHRTNRARRSFSPVASRAISSTRTPASRSGGTGWVSRRTSRCSRRSSPTVARHFRCPSGSSANGARARATSWGCCAPRSTGWRSRTRRHTAPTSSRSASTRGTTPTRTSGRAWPTRTSGSLRGRVPTALRTSAGTRSVPQSPRTWRSATSCR
jgi:hypothetical protein